MIAPNMSVVMKGCMNSAAYLISFGNSIDRLDSWASFGGESSQNRFAAAVRTFARLLDLGWATDLGDLRCNFRIILQQPLISTCPTPMPNFRVPMSRPFKAEKTELCQFGAETTRWKSAQ